MSGRDEDWALYAKGVKKIAVKKHVAGARKAAKPDAADRARAVGARPTAMILEKAGGQRRAQYPAVVQLDKRVERALRDGTWEPEARLDLHGFTEVRAHKALLDFMARHVAAGRRRLLVISGKGGVLQEAVPRWLGEPPLAGVVLAVRQAAPKHGGAGAWCVVVRRGLGDMGSPPLRG